MLIDLARSLTGPQGMAFNHETNHGNPMFGESKIIGAADPAGAPSFSDWEEFHCAVDRLDDTHREMFDLCWYSELSTSDAARIMGVDERTAQRRYRKARLAVAEMLRKSSTLTSFI
ncbi:MAG: hypothetical protein KDB00_15145 [Planctomycetales bacterium]|nr:hypothetical protein [Planctomycetales bacterium]